MDFGDRLRILRENGQLTRDDLAKKLNITYSAVSKYETNIRFPDKETLHKIADFFNVSTDYLLGRTNNRIVSEDIDFTEEELAVLEKIKSDPEISILFHDLKNASPKEIKHLIKTWDFIKQQLRELEEEQK